MTKQIKEAGTGKKKNYTKADKISVLKILEKNDCNITKTANATGINIATVRRWMKELGEEVFSTKPSNFLMQKIANEATKIDIVEINNEVKRRTIASKALDLIIKKLDDNPNSFDLDMLIQLSKIEGVQDYQSNSSPSSIIEEWTQKYTKVSNTLENK